MLTGEQSNLAAIVTIRVMHCDDSESFTSLVRHWLEVHPDIEWAGAERDPARVGDSVAATHPDVVLLDTMGQPGDPGLIEAVRRNAPEARVIVYSGYVDLMGDAGLAGGADAYLDKARDEHALLACIRAVVAR
jgi:DNA-binding NarL/FixJ family response regulator